MRNYLPFKKIRRLGWLKRRPYVVAAVVVALVAGGIAAKVVMANGPAAINECNTNFMSKVGGKYADGWNDLNTGYHYQPVNMEVIAKDLNADDGSWVTSEWCDSDSTKYYWNDHNHSGTFDRGEGGFINTTGADEHDFPGHSLSIIWNGESPVGVELGVSPQNISASSSYNNFGRYADVTTIPPPLSPKEVRPPVFMRNFSSPAAFVDDAGRATLQPLNSDFSTRYGNPTPIWCDAMDTGPFLLPSGEPNCPPDISTHPPGADQAGAGFMFAGKNCQLSNPANGFPRSGFPPEPGPAYDQDGMGPYTCATPNIYDWYLKYANSGRHLFVDGANNPSASATDLTNFIGCVGAMTGSSCSDRLNSFVFNSSVRQTAKSNFAAITVLTFRYPLTPTITITKGPVNKVYPAGGGLNGLIQYNISVAGSGPSTGKVHDLQVTDNFINPAYVNAPIVQKVQGAVINSPTSITWTFTPTMLDQINAGITENLTLTVETDADASIPGPPGNPSPYPVTNSVTATGHDISGHNLKFQNHSAGPLPETATNFIAKSQFPYLTTSGGDVHAGGGILGVSVNCATAPGNIAGQVNGATGSKGSYVVSANGAINQFGSESGTSSTANLVGLQASSYTGVCRPDMDTLAAKYRTAHGSSPYSLGALTAAAGAYPNGKLLEAPPGTTISNPTPLTVNNQVTLWVHGDLYINIPVGQSPSLQILSNLGSFGLIVDGNIYIKNSVSLLSGYYFATGKIVTCASGAMAPGNVYTGVAVIGNCTTPLIVGGLMSANSFDFNRVAPLGTVGYPATESINYLGLLFIAPPPVFDGSFTTAGATGQEEAPPLY